MVKLGFLQASLAVRIVEELKQFDERTVGVLNDVRERSPLAILHELAK